MAGTTLYWFFHMTCRCFSRFDVTQKTNGCVITGFPPNVIPLPGCVPICTVASCHTLLVLFWVPFFVFEISRYSVISHGFQLWGFWQAVFVLTVFDTWRNRKRGSFFSSNLRGLRFYLGHTTSLIDRSKLTSIIYRDGEKLEEACSLTTTDVITGLLYYFGEWSLPCGGVRWKMRDAT